jgi:type I restriction enzyme S subunit
MSWKTAQFGELASFKNGLNYSRDNWGTGMHVIGVADFQDYVKPKYETLGEINPQGVVRDGDLLEHGDLLFVRSNGNRNLIGRTVYIERPPFPVSYSGFCIRARLNDPQSCLPRFYAYLMRTNIVRRVLSAQGGRANIASLNQGILARLDVPVPPLPVQTRIADILSAYDDLIENNNRRMALLEEAIHLLYREWFVYLRFPDHERVKVVDGVPEGWERTTVSEAFSYLGGGTPSRKVDQYWTNGTIDWFSPTDLTKSGSLWMEQSKEQISEFGLSKSSAKIFPPLSVMMTSRATIGAIAINTGEACTNQGFITCLPNERVPLHFLYCWLSANTENFIGRATGSTFKELSKRVFGKMDFTLPPRATSEEFEKEVEPYAQQTLNLQRQNQRLREARDLLLPRLMNGSIVV